jgi:3-oxoacyl-[acyl-carrier protein] reductase
VAEHSGRCVVVTGAGQGLGRAVAEAFAARGDSVVVSDLASTDEVVAAIRERGGTAVSQPCDVADEAAVSELAARAVATFGAPQVWVNNAGVTRPAMLHKMESDDFDLVMRVHCRGTFLGIREAARTMMAGEAGIGGSILNVTSSAGLQGTIGQINYSAAKGAVIAATPMTEKLRTDEKLGNRFLDQIPLRRFGEPDEIAGAFTYLADPGSSYITGQVLSIDGGLYMAS